jgi:hypothetical protein
MFLDIKHLGKTRNRNRFVCCLLDDLEDLFPSAQGHSDHIQHENGVLGNSALVLVHIPSLPDAASESVTPFSI